MIRDARVLRAGFVPREVEHRDAEVNHLSSVLKPITNGEPADTAIVTGPSGAGKTCISNHDERQGSRRVDSETVIDRLVSGRVDFDWNIGLATMVAGGGQPELPVLPIIPSFKYLSHSTIASNEGRMDRRAEDVTSLV